MAAVAETAALRMLAAAPSDRPGLGDFLFLGREAGAFVRAVTERLRLGPAARTPEIGAGFGLLDKRRFLGNDRVAHNVATIFQSGKNANKDIFTSVIHHARMPSSVVRAR